jgi:hypothetical protein
VVFLQRTAVTQFSDEELFVAGDKLDPVDGSDVTRSHFQDNEEIGSAFDLGGVGDADDALRGEILVTLAIIASALAPPPNSATGRSRVSGSGR